MATLICRSNGIYYLITKINGRRDWKSTGCTRKSGALKYVLKQERNDKKTSEPMTLRQFRKQHLAYVSANPAPPTAEPSPSSKRSLGIFLLRTIRPRWLKSSRFFVWRRYPP